jgi:lysine-specific demethylase 8
MEQDDLFGLGLTDIDYRKNLKPENLPKFVVNYMNTILDDLSASNNCDRVLRLSDVVVEYAWEKLNTNLWMLVENKWRYLYGYATLYKIVGYFSANKLNSDELIKLCDLGLLMSGPLLEKQFNQIIKRVSGTCSSEGSNLPLQKRARFDEATETPCINSEFAIPVEYSPSVDVFKNNYLSIDKPVIIDGQMDHWPAVHKWNIDYIKKIAGRRTVPVEIGSKYTEDSWSQKLMTIDDFIDKFILNHQSTGYLAQHPLFDQVILINIHDLYSSRKKVICSKRYRSSKTISTFRNTSII